MERGEQRPRESSTKMREKETHTEGDKTKRRAQGPRERGQIHRGREQRPRRLGVQNAEMKTNLGGRAEGPEDLGVGC